MRSHKDGTAVLRDWEDVERELDEIVFALILSVRLLDAARQEITDAAKRYCEETHELAPLCEAGESSPEWRAACTRPAAQYAPASRVKLGSVTRSPLFVPVSFYC